MPHFDASGHDLAICQLCARNTPDPTWRPDLTGSASAGNVCPTCLKTAKPKVKPAEPTQEFQFKHITFVVCARNGTFMYKDKAHLGGPWSLVTTTLANPVIDATFRRKLALATELLMENNDV